MIGAPNTQGQKYWVGIVQWAPETLVSEEIEDIFRNDNIDNDDDNDNNDDDDDDNNNDNNNNINLWWIPEVIMI